jgi:TRAP-type C4-dicarboxylate transport system permease small subunit
MGVIAALSLVVLMFAITLDVVVRYLTKASVPGMLEIAESCLVISIFFGLPLAAVRGEHVAVSLVTDRLGAAAARACALFAWAVTSLFLAWMSWASIVRALDATQRGEERFGLIRWPIWPMRWVIVVGLVVFFTVALLNVIRVIAGRETLGAQDDVELAREQLNAVLEDTVLDDAVLNDTDSTSDAQPTATSRNPRSEVRA